MYRTLKVAVHHSIIFFLILVVNGTILDKCSYIISYLLLMTLSLRAICLEINWFFKVYLNLITNNDEICYVNKGNLLYFIKSVNL